MKKILVVLLCMFSLMLVSCGGSGKSQKAIEDGKTALVNQEYEKAKEFFETALKEDENNSTASDFLDLSKDYIELLDIVKSEDFEDLDEVLSEIESNKELELIKEDYEIVKKNALKKKDALEKENKKTSKKQESTTSSNKVTEEKNQNEYTSNQSNKEEGQAKKEESKPQSNTGNNSNGKITAEEAVEKARSQWSKDNTDSNLKNVVFNDDPALNEKNEYVIGVCSVHGEYKTVGIYYVNASTGEARFVKV